MAVSFSLAQYGIHVQDVRRNVLPAVLYEHAMSQDSSAAITRLGALAISSGDKTGRSPQDKRITNHPNSADNIWWGPINIPIAGHTFEINRERATDYLNTRPYLYVVDGYAGWSPRWRIKVRIICERPYHALFMRHMLVRPTDEELKDFGEPEYVVLNAGKFPANRHTTSMSSKTSVDISFEDQQMVILGTEYAGEMKKGVFTVMNYIMPLNGVLSMHCSANEGPEGDVSLFFGLSGTGKTTLSANAQRRLIGDDEHCWTEDGVFNIEGGCYAKVIHLSAEKEPEIYQAIRFGAVLENVVYDPVTHDVDYTDTSITENTRAAYPISFIKNAKVPSVGDHPSNIIFLTFDAFGVLPPVARLTPEQAMYHFVSGYTAKVAGTEVGIYQPQVTFSACFGAAFLVWHPTKYAELLAEKMNRHNVRAWLVNTGISGGTFSKASRISLKHTRAIIDAIHDGSLSKAAAVTDTLFGFAVPTECPGVPAGMLLPREAWSDPCAYDEQAAKLAKLFAENFKIYEGRCDPKVAQAGPRLVAT